MATANSGLKAAIAIFKYYEDPPTKKEFIKALNSSEKDHREGRIKERKSLYELIKGKK